MPVSAVWKRWPAARTVRGMKTRVMLGSLQISVIRESFLRTRKIAQPAGNKVREVKEIFWSPRGLPRLLKGNILRTAPRDIHVIVVFATSAATLVGG
jgi:hypothetical protein